MTPPWTCASDLADRYQPRSPNAGQREQPVNRGTEKRTRTLGRENCYNVIRGSKHLDQLTQPRFFQIRLNHYSEAPMSHKTFVKDYMVARYCTLRDNLTVEEASQLLPGQTLGIVVNQRDMPISLVRRDQLAVEMRGL